MTKEINLGSAWPKSFPHRKKSKQVVVWAGGDLKQCEEDDGEESRVETYFPAERVRDQAEPKNRNVAKKGNGDNQTEQNYSSYFWQERTWR